MHTETYFGHSCNSWRLAGGNAVLLTRFVERAVSLGWTRGEATGVVQAVGAVARMAAPQLFTRLWLRAVAQKGQSALPLGAPMLSVSVIALLQAGISEAIPTITKSLSAISIPLPVFSAPLNLPGDLISVFAFGAFTLR